MHSIWDFKSNTPFFGTQNQLDRLEKLVKSCIEVVAKSSNPREMVLETWIVLDYSIRDFLLSGFELARFCDDKFDLRYQLLPKSFKELLELLENTINFQSNLKCGVDMEDNRVTWSFSFLNYIHKNHRAMYEKLKKVEMEYYKDNHPELYKLIKRMREGGFYFDIKRSKTERMHQDWIAVANNLDEKWIKSAKRLNTARNKAAHSFDKKEVAKSFGITGENLIDLTRKECLKLLNVLLGVKIGKSA